MIKVNYVLGYLHRYLFVLIFTTQCFGITLYYQSNEEIHYFSNLVFTNDKRGWLLLSTKNKTFILTTEDEGETWKSSFKTKSSLLDLKFLTELDGWAVGSGGTILHTSDGGKNWITKETPTKELLYAVSVIDSDNIWAVGKSGTIVHSSDNGKTWTYHNYSKKIAFVGVNFTDKLNGYIVGYGIILKTTDGGKTWIEYESNEWKHLGKIQIIDNDGWIAGRTVLLPIKNNTVDLKGKIIPGQGIISDIYFVDRDNGWILKTRERTIPINNKNKELISEATILRTKDGGKNWEELSVFNSYSDYSYSLSSIFFRDSLRGWSISHSGTILKTKDGGKNWKESKIMLNNLE